MIAYQGGQSELVYIAQEAAERDATKPPIMPRRELQPFADRVLADPRVSAMYHPSHQQQHVPVFAEHLSAGEMATTLKHRVTGDLHILIDPRYATRRNLLHELAHVLIQEPDGDEHNADWAACYLRLLQWFDEAPYAEELTQQFHTYNVRVAHEKHDKAVA